MVYVNNSKRYFKFCGPILELNKHKGTSSPVRYHKWRDKLDSAVDEHTLSISAYANSCCIKFKSFIGASDATGDVIHQGT